MKFPALRYEAEAFQLGKERIMGRQSAGDAFLRAIAMVAGDDVVHGYGPNPASLASFTESLGRHAAGIRADWVQISDMARLAQIGGVHFPDPSLGQAARARLAAGPAAYSITGITHTISSQNAMGMLADLPVAPVMPWDALICTSGAVKSSTVRILEAQEEYLSWRMGLHAPPPRPALPVIPLGVHGTDFVFSAQERAAARSGLGLGAQETAFLFLGRLSFHAKAHPFAMYVALEAVARKTGQPIVLIQCGWFANTFIEDAFKQGAATWAPSVRHVWLDGRKADLRASAWAASDVFLSLPDNIQETFGLTPLEAMAAGLPVIVTDWDGYRETVPDGEVGFRIPTTTPQSPVGDDYAVHHAVGTQTYDQYIGLAASHISVDLAALEEAVTRLVLDEGLRHSLGAAGRRVVASRFDWSVVIRSYHDLWVELAAMRHAAGVALGAGAPRTAADRLGPFDLFANYPTTHLGEATALYLRPSGPDLARVLADPLFALSRLDGADALLVGPLLKALGERPGIQMGALGRALGVATEKVVFIISRLIKMGIVMVAGA